MIETTTVQKMKMCLDCSPGFDETQKVLAHDIGLHVYVRPGGVESVGCKKYVANMKKKHG